MNKKIILLTTITLFSILILTLVVFSVTGTEQVSLARACRASAEQKEGAALIVYDTKGSLVCANFIANEENDRGIPKNDISPLFSTPEEGGVVTVLVPKGTVVRIPYVREGEAYAFLTPALKGKNKFLIGGRAYTVRGGIENEERPTSLFILNQYGQIIGADIRAGTRTEKFTFGQEENAKQVTVPEGTRILYVDGELTLPEGIKTPEDEEVGKFTLCPRGAEDNPFAEENCNEVDVYRGCQIDVQRSAGVSIKTLQESVGEACFSIEGHAISKGEITIMPGEQGVFYEPNTIGETPTGLIVETQDSKVFVANEGECILEGYGNNLVSTCDEFPLVIIGEGFSVTLTPEMEERLDLEIINEGVLKFELLESGNIMFEDGIFEKSGGFTETNGEQIISVSENPSANAGVSIQASEDGSEASMCCTGTECTIPKVQIPIENGAIQAGQPAITTTNHITSASEGMTGTGRAITDITGMQTAAECQGVVIVTNSDKAPLGIIVHGVIGGKLMITVKEVKKEVKTGDELDDRRSLYLLWGKPIKKNYPGEKVSWKFLIEAEALYVNPENGDILRAESGYNPDTYTYTKIGELSDNAMLVAGIPAEQIRKPVEAAKEEPEEELKPVEVEKEVPPRGERYCYKIKNCKHLQGLVKPTDKDNCFYEHQGCSYCDNAELSTHICRGICSDYDSQYC